MYKVQYVNKSNHTVLLSTFGRPEMVCNVDFRDIRALEPLQKFGFWNAFVTSHHRNLFSSHWQSQGRTVEIAPVIIIFSSYLYFPLYLSLSSCEFCPEISSKTAGRIFANKVSYKRSSWGVMPSLIFIALTGLIFKLLPKMLKKFLLWTIPTFAVKPD